MNANTLARPTLFRRALLLDAATGAVTALLLIAGASFLAPQLGLPTALLSGAGLVLIPIVVLLAWLVRSPRISKWLAWSVIEMNLLWVLASFGLLLGGQVSPTLLGQIFVIVQALAVLAFAIVQFIAWRREGAVLSAPAADAAATIRTA
ncbi:hypothetical protein DFR29_115106 [Tahibacter aquaticus]|uniref:Integral membrane protein n=1 Tax=Tahibacter aquaticus TaxID=520092 RepID=A0A4R6YPK2_9GAMM|nr:hypothetical protein [Tahibacter aquaticus]TDR39716.1 hypothetical protein DFR29_115106 [Tahibacter aquaticus]